MSFAVCLASVTGAAASDGTYVTTSVDNKTGIVTVSGKLEGEKNSYAGIYVTRAGVDNLDAITPETAKEYISHAEQVYTDENGEFSFTYKLVGDDGTYRVHMSNSNGSRKADTKFVYISYESLAGYIKKLEDNRDPNNINDDLPIRTANVKKVFSSETVLNAFDIFEEDLPSGMTFTDIDDEVYGCMVQSNTKCAEKKNVKEILYSSLVAKLFNAAGTSEFESLFEECAEYLELNDKIYTIYLSSADIRSAVNSALDGYTFKSAEDVAYALTESVVLYRYKSMTHYTEFMRFVTECENAMKLNLQSYATIASPRDPLNVDRAMIEKKDAVNTLKQLRDEFDYQINAELNRVLSDGGSDGGSAGGSGKRSGSGGVSLGSNIGLGTDIVSSVKATFSDLAGFEWAESSIKLLVEKGIISGYGDGTYRPHNSIMREEAVKIIIEAFDFYDENAASDFADVDNTAWYAGYVASAQKLGIVSGIGDGCFGVGRPVCRQDMAVIIDNIFKSFGIAYPEVREYHGFADEENISSYARESVINLYRAGILNGDDLSRFNPTDSLTRAEMAKITAAVIDIAK